MLCFNEAANLPRTLEELRWARRIVIVDSFSTDETIAIAKSFPNTEVHQRAFDNHTAQWNYGLSLVETEWALTLDADYQCNERFVRELEQLEPRQDAYFVHFRYGVFGTPLRATLYPPRCALFKAKQYAYREDGHTQTLDIDPHKCGQIKTPLLHDDRKDLQAWLTAQRKYAVLEASKIEHGEARLGWKDRIRRKVFFAPMLTLLYCLFFKLLILDGRSGLYYSLQRTYAELLLSLELLDSRIRRSR